MLLLHLLRELLHWLLLLLMLLHLLRLVHLHLLLLLLLLHLLHLLHLQHLLHLLHLLRILKPRLHLLLSGLLHVHWNLRLRLRSIHLSSIGLLRGRHRRLTVRLPHFLLLLMLLRLHLTRRRNGGRKLWRLCLKLLLRRRRRSRRPLVAAGGRGRLEHQRDEAAGPPFDHLDDFMRHFALDWDAVHAMQLVTSEHLTTCCCATVGRHVGDDLRAVRHGLKRETDTYQSVWPRMHSWEKRARQHDGSAPLACGRRDLLQRLGCRCCLWC